jgi:Transcriptional regulator
MARPVQDPRIRINEILDAAEPLFYARGYHETSISDIAKRMGVAQGTLYYYFKSKDEVLEALLKRHIARLISEIEPLTYSANIDPSVKFELVIQAIIRTIHLNEKELLMEFLFDDRTIHLVDKFSRQGKQLMDPLLYKIIEEGRQKGHFLFSHPRAVVNLVSAIIDSLVYVIYEKPTDDLIECQFKLAEELFAKVLGAQPGTISIGVNP